MSCSISPRRGVFVAGAVALVVLAGWATSVARAVNCPYCTVVSQTLTEELETTDLAVIAKLIQLPKSMGKNGEVDFSAGVPYAKFEVRRALRGEELLPRAIEGKPRVVETICFDGKLNDSYLILGVAAPQIAWSTPMPLSPRAEKYLDDIRALPKDPVVRLRFFNNYLEDADETLARDAYDEFARSPYDAVKALKPEMKIDLLRKWAASTEVSPERRRLYFTMLGVCGDEADARFVENLLRSPDRKVRAGLDAMIGCYLTLRGEAGLPVVEEIFFDRPQVEYTDAYAAVTALRVSTEFDILPAPAALKSMRKLLRAPALADLVIPDFARHQDWSVMEELVTLFKEADSKTSFVRTPVVQYLQVCPLPAAAEHLKELEKIDPAAVKRAQAFFFLAPAKKSNTEPDAGLTGGAGETATSTLAPADGQGDDEPPSPEPPLAGPNASQPTAADSPQSGNLGAAKTVDDGGLIAPSGDDPPGRAQPPGDHAAADENEPGRRVAAARRAGQGEAPGATRKSLVNYYTVTGVILLCGAGLLGVLWLILKPTTQGA